MSSRRSSAPREEAKLSPVQEPVVKALMLGVDAPRSKTAGEASFLQVFDQAGGIQPPYDPQVCIKWYELSTALRPNVDAYATTIDSYGHRFRPVIDLDAEDVDEKVSDILYQRRLAESGGVADDDSLEPTAAEIEKEKLVLRRQARRELQRCEAFFKSCCVESSFIRLRRKTRTDLEVTGNAYWEVLRNRAGLPARFVWMPSYLTRLMPVDEQFTQVVEYERVSPVDYEEVKIQRRMRRFVQIDEYTLVPTYFKEFGDTRTLSAKSGRFYPSPEALASAEPGAAAASEVIHFKVDWPNSPCGVPRWVGAYPEIAGSRAASEVNYLYFDNKSVPPLAMLISGGRLAKGADKRIEDYIENNLKGRANFHKILLVEAESDGKTSAQARVELKPLNDLIQKDALFQQYDERNIDKVSAQFRVPRLLRGDTRDFNRATAEAALRLAEEQVFGPEREDFDWLINVKLLPVLGIRFWTFSSLTPVTKDPERLGKLIALLCGAGVLLPKEARRLAVDVFNVPLPDVKQAWASRPVAFTLAGIQTGGEMDGGETPDEGLLKDARNLLGLSERLRTEQEQLQQRRMAMARDIVSAGQPDTTLNVPRSEWESWFQRDEAAS